MTELSSNDTYQHATNGAQRHGFIANATSASQLDIESRTIVYVLRVYFTYPK